ncbi:MAG: hypothetical protein E7021_04165 [Alphaproteobacteria bacterium]|nr:hypothetical protein [Alphaproteobacteria bacterium]
MNRNRPERYALIVAIGAIFSVSLTLLFALTLFYQAHRDNNGRGIYVLPQFLSSRLMDSKQLITTSPFDKGFVFYDQDYDRLMIEEMLIRYYLEMRYTFFPNSAEMMRRWGWNSPMAYLSRSDIHREVVGKDLEQKIRDMGENIRTVNITKIEKDLKNDYARYIQMEIYILRPDGFLEKVQKYDVRVVFDYNNRYKVFTPNFNNPYGLYFTYIKSTLVEE